MPLYRRQRRTTVIPEDSAVLAAADDLQGKDKSQLHVRYPETESLKPYARNARTHTYHQISQVAKSIKTFGWMNPIIADQEDNVIAGRARLKAAKRLGHGVVPTICVDHLTDAAKRAYMLADNRLAERAEWDEHKHPDYQHGLSCRCDAGRSVLWRGPIPSVGRR